MMLLFLNEKGEQAKEETSGMYQLYLKETMTSSNIRRDITWLERSVEFWFQEHDKYFWKDFLLPKSVSTNFQQMYVSI